MLVVVLLEVVALGLLLGVELVLDEVDCAVIAIAVRMVIAKINCFIIESLLWNVFASDDAGGCVVGWGADRRGCHLCGVAAAKR